MKKILVMLAIVPAFALTTFAANIDEGTKELGIGGSIDVDGADGTEIDVSVTVGKFIRDGLELGLTGGIQDSDAATNWDVGGFAQYNWDLGNQWVPFVGAGAGIVAGDSDSATTSNDGSVATTAKAIDDEGLALSGLAGVKYFITEDFALQGSVDFTWASEDVFQEDSAGTDTDWVIDLGVRYHFD